MVKAVKILFINDHFTEGGAARVAAIQCNELSLMEHNSVVLVTDNSKGSKYPLNPGIPLKPIDVLTSPNGVMGMLKKWYHVTKSIRKYIKEENPDVIIAIQARMFLFTYLANLGLRYPIIAADHTSFNRDCGKLINFVRNKLYAKADGLSILTQKDYDLLGSKYPQKKVIYNPLSFEVLNEATDRDKIILCAGRLDDWKVKGFDIIIRIWANLACKYPDWTLCIAGDGKEESRNYLLNLVTSMRLAERVKLLGRVDNMKDLYAHTSIFALPSRIEGFPMVLMEAMSQGCACVAFDVYGASSEMVDSSSGIIIKDGDVESFESSLNRLLDEKNYRDKLGQNAIHAVSRFSVEEFGKNWDEYIQEIINKS